MCGISILTSSVLCEIISLNQISFSRTREEKEVLFLNANNIVLLCISHITNCDHELFVVVAEMAGDLDKIFENIWGAGLQIPAQKK